VFVAEGRSDLVLESTLGGDLMLRIQTKAESGERFSERSAKGIMHSLVGALLFTHAAGYAHLDVRPENLIMQSTYDRAPEYESCKLLTLRSATRMAGWMDRGAAPRLLPGYAPPELYSGDILLPGAQELLSKVDMYHAGVVLFMMLAGTAPFPFEPAGNELAERGVYEFEPVAAWGGISERAKHLVASLLEPDPRKRLSASQVLEHPWMTDAPGFAEEDSFVPKPLGTSSRVLPYMDI